MTQDNGSEGVIDATSGVLVAIKKTICTDKLARRVTLTGAPDSLYTIPGFVQVSHGGRLYSVIGKAYFSESGAMGAGYYFAAEPASKNYFALPN